MKSRWIAHKDKRIFIADFSELDDSLNSIHSELTAVIETLSHEPRDSVLVLTDVHYTYATDIRFLTTLLKESFPKLNLYVKKRAMVGLSRRRRYLIPLIQPLTGSKRYCMFDTRDEALDWLASERSKETYIMEQMITKEEILFPVNDKELKGILTHPNSNGPCAAIILLHGSDRSGRDDPYYAAHAENLVRSGFAVLRYDGPGWGGGSSGHSGFETLEYRTEEALAAVKYLQSRPDIKPNAVGLWGVSQGGWVCQMAAASYDSVAFIISVSGPGVTPAEQEVYRVEAESWAAGFSKDETAKAVLMRRLMVDSILSTPMYREVNLSDSRRLGRGLWNELTELTYSANPVDLVAEHGNVIEILKGIEDERWTKFLHLDEVLPMLESFPPQAWGMVKEQMRAVMTVNPADFLTKVRCPVLAIFSENDTSVPVEKSVALYKQYLREAGNTSFAIKIFPKASHTIRIDGEFAQDYFDLMVDWLGNLPIE